jgi:hypothetical protein
VLAAVAQLVPCLHAAAFLQLAMSCCLQQALSLTPKAAAVVVGWAADVRALLAITVHAGRARQQQQQQEHARLAALQYAALQYAAAWDAEMHSLGCSTASASSLCSQHLVLGGPRSLHLQHITCSTAMNVSCSALPSALLLQLLQQWVLRSRCMWCIVHR